MTERRKPPPHAWRPGQSGNPAGRTKGSGEVAKLRAAIAQHVPEIVERLTQAALSGDVGAARLLLERVIPPLKATEEAVAVTLPEGSLTEQGRAVLGAVAGGKVAPAHGTGLLNALGTLAKLTEADELERRVAALEERNARQDS